MTKFRVYGIFTGSKFLGEFEADTEDEAIDAASMSDENHVCLCHQCADDLELNDYSAQDFQAEKADE
jgi:hypothetical protein